MVNKSSGVYRVFVERREGYRNEANSLSAEIKDFLGIAGIKNVRVINRYDVEGISKEEFDKCVKAVFSQPVSDEAFFNFECESDNAFAVEYLPGQFDQRADSASQCIQFVLGGEKPAVRSAKIYVLDGDLSAEEIGAVKKHVINPVDSREAGMGKPETLVSDAKIPSDVKIVENFINADEKELENIVSEYALAMDKDDLECCREYFKSENRNPTLTELRMIDTYWSDHCRHTTFSTVIEDIEVKDERVKKAYDRYMKVRTELNRKKPVTLMDIATLAAKKLKADGVLKNLDESDEINACTVKIYVEINGKTVPYLMLFKNETHNHPTEIEPFGGAATCIGGAIRDPLSGRAYVYQAMRITGSGNPLKSLDETLKGKLPQRKIALSAAQGYSSYGNQIGLATGIVDEIYDNGYVAKHMELGAVIGAVPAENVKREKPVPGDVIVLIGGRTGRDGCGGATGSSKSHNIASIEECGAEVQKGNAPEERKLQRLFRNKEAAKLIKKCNDFGAGGVSVAIGELADGLEINLDAVPKKYDGLDGTELAISESQERMAVVLDKNDVDKFISLAFAENSEATPVAKVTSDRRLKMYWRGKTVCDISRDFLDSNGASKHIDVVCPNPVKYETEKIEDKDFESRLIKTVSDLNSCSKRGLVERFDSTIGAGTVLMPYGGKYQRTPAQSAVAKIPVGQDETTDDCSVFTFGCNIETAKRDPYAGAYTAVVDSLAKITAAGGRADEAYLSFQEFFEKPNKSPSRWGKPFAALMGAFDAQLDYGVAAIGGKDSMSGSFEDLDVPPTFVSFAAMHTKAENIISPEFKKVNSYVTFISPEKIGTDLIPDVKEQRKLFALVSDNIENKNIISAYAVGRFGICDGICKMCFGNKIGFSFNDSFSASELFESRCGAIIVESEKPLPFGTLIGRTTEKEAVVYKNVSVCLDKIYTAYSKPLESVYPVNAVNTSTVKAENISYEGKFENAPVKIKGKPRVLIPVFPGTNCEYDTAKAWKAAGAEPEIFVINNLTEQSLEQSVREFANKVDRSEIIMIPGGFSGGDEPDGSGKFITSFFRNPETAAAVTRLLDERKGLMCGICNGFQALIKLGLVPFGKIMPPSDDNPTLTFNDIGRHQSGIVKTRIASAASPWLSEFKVGETVNVPISHGEGRFVCNEKLLKELADSGRIATQYVDDENNATYDIDYNPNGSVCAVEGITSPDGRIFGKMGHSERTGDNLYKNIPNDGINDFDLRIFKGAVKYFLG